MSISVTYDPAALEFLAVETLPRTDGEPWRRERLYVDDVAGTITGGFSYSSYQREDIAFPTGEKFTALHLRFRVRDDVPIGTEIPITFEDGNLYCTESGHCHELKNAISSGQLSLPASQVDSFVLIGTDLKIIGEVTTFSFIRGDSNSDDQVDISDPIFTLGHLFLGTRAPTCDDAADANDDGIIDISDVMATLGTLFLDDGPLPSPSGFRGPDPTTDTLGCRR